MVLVKEDGSGKPNANTYALVADADAFHEGHLYATAWTGASIANKEKALVLATRLIDASYDFNGGRTTADQALQWPRECAIDPDRLAFARSALSTVISSYFDSDKIPQAVVDATCEMAREVLTTDRTDTPEGEGLSQIGLVGSVNMIFDKKDRQPIISRLAQAMLSKLGTLIHPECGTARLLRV